MSLAKRSPYWSLPALAVAVASCGTASAGESVEPESVKPSPEVRPADSRIRLNLHVFGLSYHPDREGARLSHLDNELNVGLGLNYEFDNDARGVTSFEAGFYKDSGSNWAKFAGVGYQFKLGDRWGLGADLLAIQSSTYNNGNAFIAPVPRLTYDFDRVKINAVYVPRYAPYNLFAVFAVYFTVHLGKW